MYNYLYFRSIFFHVTSIVNFFSDTRLINSKINICNACMNVWPLQIKHDNNTWGRGCGGLEEFKMVYAGMKIHSTNKRMLSHEKCSVVLMREFPSFVIHNSLKVKRYLTLNIKILHSLNMQ